MNIGADLVLPLAIGQIVTPAADFLNKYIPNKKFLLLGGKITLDGSKLRYVVVMLICFIIGIVINHDKLNFNDGAMTLTSFGLIFASSQTAYKLWYEKSMTQAKIRNVN